MKTKQSVHEPHRNQGKNSKDKVDHQFRNKGLFLLENSDYCEYNLSHDDD